MPATEIIYYAQADGSSPVIEWLEELRINDPRGSAKCSQRLRQLAMMGHELRRPLADFLRDGVYELRAARGHVQYRMLYFFHGRNVAIVAHAIIKPGFAVDPIDIERAVQRKAAFGKDPAGHTYREVRNDQD